MPTKTKRKADMEINAEKRKLLISTYFKKLTEVGVPVNVLKEKYGSLLEKATYSNNMDTGLAFDGSLIYTILYEFTPKALKLNDIYDESLRLPKATIVKACLLCQIGKCLMFEPNDDRWEVEKRGLLYKFVNDGISIRTGLRSVCICQECGIPLSPLEVEMMTINDREATEMDARFHASIGANIVRQASEIIFLTHRKEK